MIPIILDTDIGTDVDDALALTLAVHSPKINIQAVITVGGDVRLRGDIARKLLRVFGHDEIPAAVGCNRRLNGNEFKPMPISRARGFIENEQEEFPLLEQHAVDSMIELLQAANIKIALVLIGLVNNAAMALKRCSQIKKNRAIRCDGWERLPKGYSEKRRLGKGMHSLFNKELLKWTLS